MYWPYTFVEPMWSKKNNFELNQKQKKSMNPKNMVTIFSGVWTFRISPDCFVRLDQKGERDED